ncbi:UDP-N-acetylmuramoyl-L-alanyl-D-glutamate--2,6-diaminopimelate ligase [Caldibacillus lycopersici]|uniref:UDP-N-acetylmuramoyl-L-alanyl-D-glutamate--2,6-diaminopimelate ligase n=1 Tax=Perspicuibacillus lycopersici TaxID=1325689 RepID=A0AAE3IRR1_9BACI|nr:UDP-N-acetylmuramoyl-L-alanyl-D-glutamate--2,6-diaminopimelate ligase [Perspicuibacillus lycopersici]MCU9612201.1 UDP-N-acetylmuramoyl-L-alanyl-D-glutamate--2,6-diaminopimelate ligase [Perspicuibacillus lycopersici]
MKLHSLLEYLPFAKQIGDHNPEILSIEQDTRKVMEGTLFICIKGSIFDGHTFAQAAVEKGAVAIVASEPVKVDVPVISVPDTNRAMAILADAFYGHPSQKLYLIGITGTNGKTSVSHMVQHIFNEGKKKTGLIGTLYTKIGEDTFETKNTTPDSLTLQKTYHQMVRSITDVVSMEVSSHALVNGRVWGSDFDVAVFTNLTQDHLDYHKTMDEYKQAKGLLFSRLGNKYDTKHPKFAVLNADDDASSYYESITSAHILKYGIEQAADVKAFDIQFSNKGTTYSVKTPVGESVVHVNLVGIFNVYNTLATIAVGLCYGLPLADIVTGLSTFQGVPGRFELVNEHQEFPVIVDYAHTPDSLENVLTTVQSMAKGRVFVVVGCGGDRDKTKRPIMAQIACQYATDPIFTSDNPRSEDPQAILKDMEAGVTDKQYKVIIDRKDAIKYAINEAGKDDIVLIAGKGHETYQIIGEQVLDFDDRLVAREAIRNRV